MTNHPSLISPSRLLSQNQLHQVNHHHHHQPTPSSSSGINPSLNQSQTIFYKSKKIASSEHPLPYHHQPNPPSSSHSVNSSSSSIIGLWMLVDGIGLAIITAATILEGIELWKGVFETNWNGNSGSLLLWLCGRTSQIIGLLFLIGHAASFQIFPQIEQFGMLLLTIGPILNLSCCISFHIPSDIYFLYNRQWFCSESLELLGILILDVSLIHMEEIYVFIAEVTGFLTLCCAAGLHFEYQLVATRLLNPVIPSSSVIFLVFEEFPEVTLRLDMVHGSECIGLMLLIVVAYGQLRLKLAKEHEEANLPHYHQQNILQTPQKRIAHT